MRGHIVDMDRLMEIANAAGLPVVEDCAHTMGAAWAGTPSGRHGAIGCYSTQTYKHANSGEGGFVVTDDADLAAKMILMSGSYMFFDRHGAAPDPETVAVHAGEMPNVSGGWTTLASPPVSPDPDRGPTPTQCRESWTSLTLCRRAGRQGSQGLTVIRCGPTRIASYGSSIQFSPLLATGAEDADIRESVVAVRKAARRSR